ncbi:PEP-CTERM -sorting domain protein [Lyngbya aestuarii BL J]|uniref:PEP-CTERM-sorting domain protein n=1 Tax=Lyngbya aestuarii BL J TaxID=1348334 RepID=U7QKN7_9CYAN|nr:PEP-CTERM sorting domain-containing protein [Lyngbya aestuarii]ERT08428.1 PEP-CTERM -sorting domain protein [Lyngbya aestuarii BL J]
MLKQLQQRFNLVLTSIPVLTTLTVTASPSIAATFASSDSIAFLYEFSQTPLSVETLADTETFAFASQGSVDANADADAIFQQTLIPYAENYSSAIASGEGKEYLGIANSEAAVIGRNFFIEAGSTFSFDFVSVFDLETSIDNPLGEAAIAEGNISFFLFDDSTENIIDYFTISGKLKTAGDGDFLEVQQSSNFLIQDFEFQDFEGNQEFIYAVYLGQYFSQEFSEDTSLTLVEVKTNSVIVKAPEPSSFVAFFIFGVTGMALRKRKQS